MIRFLIFCISVAILSCVIVYQSHSTVYIQPASSSTCPNICFLTAESDKLTSDSDENEANTFFEKLSMWCTKNSDFISLLELVVSVFTAGITIYLTIKIANLPYTKKLYFWSYNAKIYGTYIVFITLINSGHQAVRIEKIEVYCDRKHISSYIVPKHSKEYLGVGCSQQFEIELPECEVAQHKGKKMKIIVFDIQGKKYKFTSGFQLG